MIIEMLETVITLLQVIMTCIGFILVLLVTNIAINIVKD